VGGTLRLTPTGYAQDLLGTWRRRKQKRSHRNPGATIINDRQYEAGRAIEHMIDAMAGKGNLRSFDLTVPVVTNHSAIAKAAILNSEMLTTDSRSWKSI